MRVVIDNSIVKEIVNYLVKDKAIIDDFAKFTDLTGFGDYHVTSYGIDNLRTDFHRIENTYKCYNPSILDDLGLPNNACFNRLKIYNIETFIDYKEKSNNELNIYLQKTYFKAIKDLLKIPDYQEYDDFIYISQYPIDESFIKEFENIKFRQFFSFREFVEQYCNGFNYIEPSWINSVLQSIDEDKFYTLWHKDISTLTKDPDLSDLSLLLDHTALYKHISETELINFIDSQFEENGINNISDLDHKITDVQIHKRSYDSDDFSVTTDPDGIAIIELDFNINLICSIHIPPPMKFANTEDLSWDSFLDNLLNEDSELQFFDNGECIIDKNVPCTISLETKSKELLGFYISNLKFDTFRII